MDDDTSESAHADSYHDSHATFDSQRRRPELSAWQRRFFELCPELPMIRSTLESIPGSLVYVKDRESRFVYATESVSRRLGLKDPAELIFARDFDFFPPAIAEILVADDREVIETGEPIIGKLGFRYLATFGLHWTMTSKHPLRDEKGEVIGLIGVSCDYCGSDHNGSFRLPEDCDPRLKRAVGRIWGHTGKAPTNEEIAKISNVSVRQLNRLFHGTFGLSPQRFATIVCVFRACQLLSDTEMPILDIALFCGFSDQSAFTMCFRRFIGMTPRQYRLRWGGRRKR